MCPRSPIHSLNSLVNFHSADLTHSSSFSQASRGPGRDLPKIDLVTCRITTQLNNNVGSIVIIKDAETSFIARPGPIFLNSAIEELNKIIWAGPIYLPVELICCGINFMAWA